MFNLGNMYCDGRGVAKDDTKAAEWYLKAAEHGHGKVGVGLSTWPLYCTQNSFPYILTSILKYHYQYQHVHGPWVQTRLLVVE